MLQSRDEPTVLWLFAFVWGVTWKRNAVSIPACVSRVHCMVIKYENSKLHTVMASGFPKRLNQLTFLSISYIYCPFLFPPQWKTFISFAHSNILVYVFLMTWGDSLFCTLVLVSYKSCEYLLVFGLPFPYIFSWTGLPMFHVVTLIICLFCLRNPSLPWD